MKLIIDIPEKVVTAIQNGEDYRFDIHTAIAQGIPCEEKPQSDLISRKWLTDAIRNRRTYLSYEDAKDVIDLINKAPSVDIKDEIAGAYNEGYACGSRENERPQGEWLKDCENCDCNHCYESGHRFTRKDCSGTCSVCGVYSCCTDNFCPNCGADMQKGGAE